MSDSISLPFLDLCTLFGKVVGGTTCLCASLAGPHARAYGIVLKKRKNNSVGLLSQVVKYSVVL